MLFKIKLSLTSFPCENMSRLCSTEEHKGGIGGIFSETLQAQESHPTVAAEVQVDSVPFPAVSQESVEYEGWRLVTAHTRERAAAPPEDWQLENRFGTSHNRYEGLELGGVVIDS